MPNSGHGRASRHYGRDNRAQTKLKFRKASCSSLAPSMRAIGFRGGRVRHRLAVACLLQPPHEPPTSKWEGVLRRRLPLPLLSQSTASGPAFPSTPPLETRCPCRANRTSGRCAALPHGRDSPTPWNPETQAQLRSTPRQSSGDGATRWSTNGLTGKSPHTFCANH